MANGNAAAAALGQALQGQYSGGSPGTPGPNYYYDPRRAGPGRRSTRGTIYDPYYTSPDFYQQYGQQRFQDIQARLQREWQAEQERKRYQRFRGFVDPLLSEYQSFIGGGGPQTQYDPNDPALLAMTGAIEQRGGEAQAELQSILAGSGNIRAGALGEASARRVGETEALVAGKRGEFAQAASDRALREWEARINNYSRLIQEALGSYF